MSAGLSLYVHLPWCVRKCPYCDFNSHALRVPRLPEQEYVDALLRDLEFERARRPGSAIASVFFGGGTPSLFSAAALGRFLAALDRAFGIAADAEITLEANPGSAEAARFRDYRALGINRLSIGVQSFDDARLAALGRVHGAAEARAAAAMAGAAGFDNFNIDLMYGLPQQEPAQALADLRAAVACAPAHLSWYQLTIEPNTLFHHAPPPLPGEDAVAAMQEAGMDLLAESGFVQYEVSAFARAGRRCRHNLNYWEFGDYLGLGAGAHDKLCRADGTRRAARQRVPERYQALAGSAAAVAEERRPGPDELAFEFMLNAARLVDGFELELFRARTGLAPGLLAPGLAAAARRGLVETDARRVRPTALGRRFLNELLQHFVPEPAAAAI